jgi:hypothetical protein
VFCASSAPLFAPRAKARSKSASRTQLPNTSAMCAPSRTIITGRPLGVWYSRR